MNNMNKVNTNFDNNSNNNNFISNKGKIDVIKVLKDTSYMRNTNNYNNANYGGGSGSNYNSNNNNFGGSSSSNNNQNNSFNAESRIHTLKDLNPSNFDSAGTNNYNSSNNSASFDNIGKKCLDYTNDFRKKNGLRPLA